MGEGATGVRGLQLEGSEEQGKKEAPGNDEEPQRRMGFLQVLVFPDPNSTLFLLLLSPRSGTQLGRGAHDLSESLQWWVKMENSPSERWAIFIDRNKTKRMSYITSLVNR